MSSKFLSLERLLNSPPRISSQFGPHTILSICLPVIRLRGRAVGVAFISGAPLVAYHADFDRQFLARAMRNTPGAHQRWEWIDVAWLAPALLDQLIVQRSLDDWCAAYGISHVARHNAVSDAFATAELLLILLARASGKGIRNVGELRDCADDARRLARLEPPLGV